MTRTPGEIAGSALERKIERARISVEQVRDVACTADIHVVATTLGSERKSPQSIVETPFVDMEGRITAVKGKMPHGVTCLSFADGAVANDGLTPGPLVRARYGFSEQQIETLIRDKGIMEADCQLSDVLQDCTLEDIPITCDFSTAVVEAEDGSKVPFTFTTIHDQYNIGITKDITGYDLVPYFEDSEAARKFARGQAAITIEPTTSREVAERVADDVVADYNIMAQMEADAEKGIEGAGADVAENEAEQERLANPLDQDVTQFAHDDVEAESARESVQTDAEFINMLGAEFDAGGTGDPVAIREAIEERKREEKRQEEAEEAARRRRQRSGADFESNAGGLPAEKPVESIDLTDDALSDDDIEAAVDEGLEF